MLDLQDTGAAAVAADWIERFAETLAGRSDLRGLFVADAHWRDLVALTGELRTTSGAQMPAALLQALCRAGAGGFALHPRKVAPQRASRAGRDVIEAGIVFQTDLGSCEGVVRLVPDQQPVRAWTLLTALDALRDTGSVADEPAYARDVRAPNWLDNRNAARAYADRDPAVLVVGGGHAGLSAAAALGGLGIDSLVIDREKRIGDNWRLRYHNLKLHNQIDVNHMPHLSFPRSFPRYISKDQIANWLEIYTEALEINFWTETSLQGASWDEARRCWTARLAFGDGRERVLRPRHIVMAASTSAVPRYPDIPSLESFAGPKLHAAEFEIGAQWEGRPVMVLGTGTSSHDICQHLHAHGAEVTMVQRSPTMVVNVEPTAQLYDGLYLDTDRPIEEIDLLNASFPVELTKRSHQILTRRIREEEKDFYDRLSAAGFRLAWGDDDTGWPTLYRTRGGGYYFNIGCSELIMDGEIDLIQLHDIERFVADGVRMLDGSHRPAELVVMCTGYQTQGHLVARLFGEEVRDRAGQVWGFNDRQEMANMWTGTGQPGLWFTAGAFSQCRIYSKHLAQQIAIDERRRASG